MFPDSFYPNGLKIGFVLFALFYLALYIFIPAYRKIGLKTVLVVFILGNFLDFLTTELAILRFGIEVEQNQFAYALMVKGWYYYMAWKVLLVPTLFTIAGAIAHLIGCLSTTLHHLSHSLTHAVILSFTTLLYIIALNNIVAFFKLLAQ